MDLFNEYEACTSAAKDLEKQLYDALGPIYEQWQAKGASVRDITSIAFDTVSYISSTARIMNAVDQRRVLKNKQENPVDCGNKPIG